MGHMMTDRHVRAWAGLFFIAVGGGVVIICGLAFMNVIAAAGSLSIIGCIGGLCAVTTGVRWVREAVRPEMRTASAAFPPESS